MGFSGAIGGGIREIFLILQGERFCIITCMGFIINSIRNISCLVCLVLWLVGGSVGTVSPLRAQRQVENGIAFIQDFAEGMEFEFLTNDYGLMLVGPSDEGRRALGPSSEGFTIGSDSGLGLRNGRPSGEGLIDGGDSGLSLFGGRGAFEEVRIVALSCNSYSREAGKPCLPVYHRIVEVPEDVEVTVSIGDAEWRQWRLPDGTRLTAAAGAQSKAGEWQQPLPDPACYGANRSYSLPLAQLTPMGHMRDSRLMRLTLSPFVYNPVSGEVAVCTRFTVNIRYRTDIGGTTSDGELPNGDRQDQGSHGMDRKDRPNRGLATKAYRNELPGEGPSTYLIVSPERYLSTLEPLMSWKRQEGYLVETLTVADSNRDSIKAQLDRRYANADLLHPAPQHILLVGNADEIPPFVARHRIGGLETHRTDLYYSEFTGDYLPDALLGRLPVNDTTELRHIVEKTLDYEQFRLADSSYLSRSLLVAGKELTHPAPTVTNGQVNYLKQLLMQHDNTHDTLCYYNPQSDTLSDEIYSQMQTGVGLVNYTSHCLAWGWRHPMLGTDHIDSLAEDGKLFVAINNCCRANQIIVDCFGAHLLRKPHAAAVGAIGATNETLWEEDYWWSVGSQEEVTLAPQYSSENAGAYDHLFHMHQEPPETHALSMGQLLQAGNWAVSQSGSPYDSFYWEIYSLLGDPTLMPYIGIPDAQQLTVDSIEAGDMEITLHGTPYSRVAATRNDTLMGVVTLDGSGHGTMHCYRPLTDSLLITATAQFHKPLQRKVGVQPVEGARLIVTGHALHDSDGNTLAQPTLCDSALLTLSLRNIGQETSQQHQLTLRSAQLLRDTTEETTIAPLQAQEATTWTTWICPTTRGAALLSATLTHDSTAQTLTIGFDVVTPHVTLADATLTFGDSAVTSVAPQTDYTLRVTIANGGRGKAKAVTLTDSASQQQLTLGDIEAGGTVEGHLQLTTPMGHEPYTLALRLQHRTDSADYRYSYPTDSTTSIATAATQSPIALYPNPCNEQVTLKGLQEPTHITIYDSFGRKVAEFFAQNADIIQYSTHTLRCGCYNVLMQSAHHREVRKLTIVR